MSSGTDAVAASGAGDEKPLKIEPSAVDLAFSKDDDALNAAPVHTYSVINKERQPMQIASLAWNCLGDCLAVGTSTGPVVVLTTDPSGKSIAKQIASTSSATATRVNTVGWHTQQDRLMLSGGDDKMFRVWDMRKLAIVQRHTVAAPVQWTAVSRDGTYTAVGVGSSQVDIFDIRGSTKALHSHKLQPNMRVRDGSFGADGTLYLAGGAPTDHGLRLGGVWPLANACTDAQAQPAELLVGHSLDALCVDMHWDSGLMAVGSSDATCTLWQVEDGMPTCAVDRPLLSVGAASWSPCARYLALGSEASNVEIVRVADGSRIRAVEGSMDCAALSWAPKSGLLAMAGSQPGTIRYLQGA